MRKKAGLGEGEKLLLWLPPFQNFPEFLQPRAQGPGRARFLLMTLLALWAALPTAGPFLHLYCPLYWGKHRLYLWQEGLAC